jgi:hypothetical protein
VQRYFKSKLTRGLVVVCGLLSACGGGSGGTGLEPQMHPGLPEVVTVAPEGTGDGWRVSTPEAEGMDGNLLLEGLESRAPGEAPAYCSGGVVVLGHTISAGRVHRVKLQLRSR